MVVVYVVFFFLGRNTARSCQAKEERLDDQSLTGSATGQRLRQPVLPEETEDGQGTNTHTHMLRYMKREQQAVREWKTHQENWQIRII